MDARRWGTAAGGGLVLGAFFVVPLLGSLTGVRLAVRLWPLWLVPLAAVALVVLACRPVSVRRQAWIVGVASVTALAHVVALMVLRRPAGASAVYAAGIDPAGAAGPGYWLSVAGLGVALSGGLLVVRARPVVAGAVAGVLLGTLAGSVVLDDRNREVVLLEAGALGAAAFGPDLTGAPEPVTPVRRAGQVAGDDDELFGGTFGRLSCARNQIAALVASPESGWLAGGEGVGELTPVRLRADVLVTAHGFAGGRAYPYRAVLQAGTAVLADRRGMPRVRCAGVIPLTPPRPVNASRYLGTAWDGFDPGSLVTVTPAARDVRQFGLAGSGRSFRRPAGTDGGKDVDLVPAQAVVDGTYVLKGRQNGCDLSNCGGSLGLDIDVTVSGCPERCLVSSANWTDPARMTETSGAWTATGRPNSDSGFSCNDKVMTATTYALTLRPRTGRLVAGLWTAEQVEGAYGKYVEDDPTGCRDGKLTWELTGARSG